MSLSFTSTILMIRPARFAFNAETADNNAFQKENQALSESYIQARALTQFDGMADILRKAGVEVIVYQDTLSPHTPDSIFPNNWVSFHAEGRVILYPMYAPNRRLERDPYILNRIEKEGYTIAEIKDYSTYEEKLIYLEGTGSLILDRENKIAYACLSPRTHLNLLITWGQDQGYRIVSFYAVDENEKDIYHTNVMMCLGHGFAIVVEEAVQNLAERNNLLDTLKNTGHEIISLSYKQMNAFAGNMLQLQNKKGEFLLMMSQKAYNALTIEQVNRIEKYTKIIFAAIDDIEQNGGGSARCMMAEIFLPTSKP